jgi:hypothetical protein
LHFTDISRPYPCSLPPNQMIDATPIDQLVDRKTQYKEELLDYPYAVPGWEEKQAQRMKKKVEDLEPPPLRSDTGFTLGRAYVYVLEK